MNLQSLLSKFDERFSLPGMKSLVSRVDKTDPEKTSSVAKPLSSGFLSSEMQSQFAAIRAAVGQDYTIWPQARLCDFVTVERPIQNLSAVMLMERSKVPFVLCDPETSAPKCIIRFEKATTAKSFSSLERQEREIIAKQDAVFRGIGLSVILIYAKDNIGLRLRCALDPNEQTVSSSTLGRRHPIGSLATSVLTKLRTQVAKAASQTLSRMRIAE